MTSSILRGFSDELVKLAVGDVSAEAPTNLFNDPAETGRMAVEQTQGRVKNLPGGIAGQFRVNPHKSVPPPETTPSSMLGYIP